MFHRCNHDLRPGGTCNQQSGLSACCPLPSETPTRKGSNFRPGKICLPSSAAISTDERGSRVAVSTSSLILLFEELTLDVIDLRYLVVFLRMVSSCYFRGFEILDSRIGKIGMFSFETEESCFVTKIKINCIGN